jgi:hypothetical protein
LVCRSSKIGSRLFVPWLGSCQDLLRHCRQTSSRASETLAPLPRRTQLVRMSQSFVARCGARMCWLLQLKAHIAHLLPRHALPLPVHHMAVPVLFLVCAKLVLWISGFHTMVGRPTDVFFCWMLCHKRVPNTGGLFIYCLSHFAPLAPAVRI